jgi:hypothetical protein
VTRFVSVMQIDVELEMAKTRRECFERAVVKAMSGQLGEAWVGLDDRRAEHSPMRGPDRRSDP